MLKRGLFESIGPIDYGWDVGRITQIQRYDALSAYTTYYGYDACDRLTSEIWRDTSGVQTNAFLYAYDAAGNRTKERKERAAGIELESAYYAYDADNSLTRRQSMPANVTTYYYYDTNGAQTKAVTGTDTTYFTYGPNQLVTSITPPSGSADKWTFYYDGQLNRYRIDKGALGTRYLLWDGLNCLEERDASGVLKVRYSYGYTPIYGIGSCVEIYIPSDDTYTMVMDHRGTASMRLKSNGMVISEILFVPSRSFEGS